MKKKFKLNILDITIISAVVLIIIASVITVWQDKTADKIKIAIVLFSDEYYSEVFAEIKNGAEIYNSSSGKLIGEVHSVQIVGEAQEKSRIEIEVLAEAEEFGNGAVIDGDRYYMGDRLNVNAGNSRIVGLVKEIKTK